MIRLNFILNHLFSLDKFLGKVERDMTADADVQRLSKDLESPKEAPHMVRLQVQYCLQVTAMRKSLQGLSNISLLFAKYSNTV